MRWLAERLFRPQVRPQRASTGSGFVLEGRRLLTNAHGAARAGARSRRGTLTLLFAAPRGAVVLSGTTVHVRREGRPKKFPARVLCCAPAVDLALLTVDDEEFWHNLCPLQLAAVPHLQDSVVVVGYPVGGDSICVTKGVVSRVDLRPYIPGGNSLLTVQVRPPLRRPRVRGRKRRQRTSALRAPLPRRAPGANKRQTTDRRRHQPGQQRRPRLQRHPARPGRRRRLLQAAQRRQHRVHHPHHRCMPLPGGGADVRRLPRRRRPRLPVAKG